MNISPTSVYNHGNRNLGRSHSAALEVKARGAKNFLGETNYYRETVKVAFLLIFVMTFSLIVLISRLISSLSFVLEYAFQRLRKVDLMETEKKETEPRSETGYERRKYPRFDVYWPIQFNQIGSSVSHEGRVTNFSGGGMLIEFSGQMEVGQHLKSKVSFILDSEVKSIEMLAEVVRRDICSGKARGDYQCGVKFLGVSQRDKTKLNDLLMSLYTNYRIFPHTCSTDHIATLQP